MSEPIGVAVIGAGGIAEAHLYAYQKAEERVKLLAVVDVAEERARAAAGRYGVPGVATDYHEVLERDDVRAVSVCTPPALHVEISVAALKAGKHVLCEKPVAPTPAGVDAIEEAQAASGRIFSGVFQLRFGKGAQQLRLLVDQGSLGRVHLGLAETLWYRDAAYFSVPWRATWAEQCGGVLVSQAIHLVDQLIWYLGRPLSVYAFADVVRGLTECDETSVAVVRFESGAIGQITSTVTAVGPQKARLELYGTEASAVSHGSEYDATSEPFIIGAADPEKAAALQAELEERVPRGYRMLHRGQVDDFLSAIEDDRPASTGIEDCRAAVHLTAGIYKSAMTGAPVNLPLDRADPWYHELPPRGFSLAAKG